MGARYEIEYRAARAQFGLLARKAGARVEGHENPSARGPFGEALIADVAYREQHRSQSQLHGLRQSAAGQCALSPHSRRDPHKGCRAAVVGHVDGVGASLSPAAS
ncbi:MAG: DUF2817 domain-containing protein [Alphaproteobacteria bacterium]|nr:DUF2817 domain-containing protein [Alphaproteobacteria bacterium]